MKNSMINTWIAAVLVLSTFLSCQEELADPQPDQSSTWELLCGRKWRLAEATSRSDTPPYGPTTTYYQDELNPRLIWEFGCDGHFETSHLYAIKGEWTIDEDAMTICKKATESNGQILNSPEMKCEYYVLEINDSILSIKFQARPGWVYHVFKLYDDNPMPTKK